VDAVADSRSNGFDIPPYSIGGNRYINGGYRRNENADLATGYARVLVLCCHHVARVQSAWPFVTIPHLLTAGMTQTNAWAVTRKSVSARRERALTLTLHFHRHQANCAGQRGEYAGRRSPLEVAVLGSASIT
jgi:hypothetical protein